MPYLETRGVSAYYDLTGEGEPVVFLHGGFCSAEVMRELSEQLTGYSVLAHERPAHGRTPDRPGPFHYADGVADTLVVLDALGWDSAHVVGFSDGAIIGMLLALGRADRVRSLAHISGNISTGPEVYRADDDPTITLPAAQWERIAAENARLAPDGTENAADVSERITRMWETEPNIEPGRLATLAMPVLVMAGDSDVIALEHTTLIHRSIPGSQLAIIPAATHMLVRERPALIGAMLQEFLDGVGR